MSSRCHGFTKHTQKLSSCEMYKYLWKRIKRVCPFSFVKAKTKKGRKHLAVNRQQTPLRATKVLLTTKTNGYDRGYEKSKNMNANRIRVKSSRLKWVPWSRSKIRLEEAEEARLQRRRCPAGAELLAAAIDRFLVFGIFTNLAVIKAKVIKMFSLLRVNSFRSQSNDSAFTNLKE